MITTLSHLKSKFKRYRDPGYNLLRYVGRKKKLIILFLGEVQSAQVKVKASFCLGEESIQTKRVIREHKLRS